MKRQVQIALAKLNLGLLEDNEGHFELALSYFKEVVQAYPESEQAISAVQAARNSYIALGRVQQYAQWVEGLDFISVEEASLDQASFESAKQALAEGRMDLATDRFENYLVNYPSGTYLVEAHHHLSEIYWQKQDENAAIIHSEIVARADNSASRTQFNSVGPASPNESKTGFGYAYFASFARTTHRQRSKIFRFE